MTYKRVIITKFGPPEVLQLIEEPHLPEPKPGEIRVRVLATSAAFTDTMIRKGAYPNVKEKPPFSPGYDMVGVVDKPGEDTSKFKVDDRVCDLTVIGAYSEYLKNHKAGRIANRLWFFECGEKRKDRAYIGFHSL